MKDPLPLLFLPEPRPGGGAGRGELARAALRGGASSIQLRAKDLTFHELVEEGRALGRICRDLDRPFLVNDRVDVAAACEADGVHLGPEDMSPREARGVLGGGALIGVSVYGPRDLEEAAAADASYVAVGAIYPTATKEIEVAGLDGLRNLRGRTALPVVAIGGITSDTAAEVIAAGADGIAVVSALSGARDVEAEAALFRRIIDEALAQEGRGG